MTQHLLFFTIFLAYAAGSLWLFATLIPTKVLFWICVGSYIILLLRVCAYFASRTKRAIEEAIGD